MGRTSKNWTAAGLALCLVVGTSSLAPKVASASSGCYTAVGLGGSFGVGLDADGTVATWGANYFGLLGYGTPWAGQPNPVAMPPAKVPGLSGFTSVAAGGFHVMALRSDGTVWTWGSNYAGQLGNGSYDWPNLPAHVTPTPAVNLANVTSIAAGPVESMAIEGDGSLWAWGDNTEGQVGNGSSGGGLTSNANFVGVPTRVVGPNGNGYLDGVTAASPGEHISAAVRSDGTAWTWGGYLSGSVYDGTAQFAVFPTQVPGLANVIGVATGYYSAFAVEADGSVWTWNAGGTSVAQVQGLSGITQISVSRDFGLALKSDGTVWGWGNNYNEELLDPSLAPHSTPIQLSGLSNVVRIVAGPYGAFAIEADGSVLGWGAGNDGQLGTPVAPAVGHPPAPVSLPCATAVGGAAAPTVVTLAVAAPVITVKNSTYTPMPFYLSATVTNTGSNPTQNLSLNLTVPSGLALWQGETAIHSIGSIAPGSSVTTRWLIAAEPQFEAAITFSFTVAATADNAPTVNATGSVTIPLAWLYEPSSEGYSFPNSSPFNIPTYAQMAAYYPASRSKIYLASGTPTNVGKLFYDKFFSPTYAAGLCYGMATSDTFLFNQALTDPTINANWATFSDAFNGQSLNPAVVTPDTTIEQFIDRYHARQFGAAGARSSIQSWSAIGSSPAAAKGNLQAFDQVAAEVKIQPQVVALGPSPWILSGGPDTATDPSTGLTFLLPPPNPVRFWNLYNNSHAVVAYATTTKLDGTRVIYIYDPSSPNDNSARIEINPSTGGIKLIDFANSPPGSTQESAWFGGGIDLQHRDMGQPTDWVLMPLADAAFSEAGNVAGYDNDHWIIPDGVATAINLLNAPHFILGGSPVFRFSDPGPGASVVVLPARTAYSNVITATGSHPETAVTIGGHIAAASQGDVAAAGTSHRFATDANATSVHLDSATATEMYAVELSGDYLPDFSRKIRIEGLSLAPGGSVDVASDNQTSGLSLSSSDPTSATVTATLEQTGANPGNTAVQLVIPAGSVPASVSVYDWNALSGSLIYEVIDPLGAPSGSVLQGNALQLQTQVSRDLDALRTVIAGVQDAGLRQSLQAKVDNAQDMFTHGNRVAAANDLMALRNEIDAQAGKGLSDSDAKNLRLISADALVLLRSA